MAAEKQDKRSDSCEWALELTAKCKSHLRLLYLSVNVIKKALRHAVNPISRDFQQESTAYLLIDLGNPSNMHVLHTGSY